ncbi:hypothetical protein QOZ98_000918 [Planomicrobium stackebrandtii]|uniref:Uncharacterized protein n=1 Tax=Planomicrobium stackebrandtii TaxID=253160 RepID=A0ABU0GU53_9BACL|nr:hypothetical protein [Planomicrobium stackebrandtii]MDQ0428092.1 hypothetical protein [Planomicrobium stackebrandtii]
MDVHLNGRHLVKLSIPLLTSVMIITSCQEFFGLSPHSVPEIGENPLNTQPAVATGTGEDLEQQTDKEHFETFTIPELKRIHHEIYSSWEEHFGNHNPDPHLNKVDGMVIEADEFISEYSEIQLALESLEFLGTPEEVQALNGYRENMLEAISTRLAAAAASEDAPHSDNEANWEHFRQLVQVSYNYIEDANIHLSKYEDQGNLMFSE